MTADRAEPDEFWLSVAALVRSKVEPALGKDGWVREPVIEYLRDLEVVARQECTSREVVQVIALGRHLLGDDAEVGKDMARIVEMALAKVA
ncbi:hypothetical protein J2X36_004616 [Methylobacterium sp. BE186]|uniref:hypothetical protein n=1 Tax=Methylobacterium sp. BE186 TaxID=2817715 RepID=UPI00285CB285|nr:hypothetical protein [Methylobacterium sp. BE186]MDR7039838.1 hypothetical protein [Methylobacterium sp. BE186]